MNDQRLGSFYQELGPLPEPVIAFILRVFASLKSSLIVLHLHRFCDCPFSDVVSALDYLHTGLTHLDAVCLHGDVKAANILLSSTGHAKLVDFGVSTLMAPGTLILLLVHNGAASVRDMRGLRGTLCGGKEVLLHQSMRHTFQDLIPRWGCLIPSTCQIQIFRQVPKHSANHPDGGAKSLPVALLFLLPSLRRGPLHRLWLHPVRLPAPCRRSKNLLLDPQWGSSKSRQTRIRIHRENAKRLQSNLLIQNCLLIMYFVRLFYSAFPTQKFQAGSTHPVFVQFDISWRSQFSLLLSKLTNWGSRGVVFKARVSVLRNATSADNQMSKNLVAPDVQHDEEKSHSAPVSVTTLPNLSPFLPQSPVQPAPKFSGIKNFFRTGEAGDTVQDAGHST
eukprot:284818180_4